MSYLHPAVRASIEQQLTAKQNLLASVTAAYEAAIGAGEVHSYMLDTGEGKQAVTHRDPEKLWKQMRNLQTEVDRLARRLTGSGLHTVTLRRGQ